jgi:hypothetical protein
MARPLEREAWWRTKEGVIRTLHLLSGEVQCGAEIGVFRGRTASAVMSEFPSLTLYLVDPYKDEHFYGSLMRRSGGAANAKRDAHKTLHRFKDRCIWFECLSTEAAKKVDDETLDYVFIDGNHDYEYVKEDIALWVPKVRSGGIVMGHDYSKRKTPGVIRAVNEIFKCKIERAMGTSWWVWKDDI